MFMLAVFLLRSSGRGSVRLGSTQEAGPTVVAPPLPEDAHKRLRHAFDQLAAWERSVAFRALKLKPLIPHDLEAPDAVATALERNTMSYGHMVGTCPMGPVLDADCRVHGIPNLRVADASVMPTIPRGNTYLGCVMVAERIARKMKAGIATVFAFAALAAFAGTATAQDQLLWAETIGSFPSNTGNASQNWFPMDDSWQSKTATPSFQRTSLRHSQGPSRSSWLTRPAS
jgi:hypothetical protein